MSSSVARKSTPAAAPERVRERACRLLRREIEYVHSPRFDAPGADAPIGEPYDGTDSPVEREVEPPPGLPAYVAELYRVPLLTPWRERRLFLTMNHLKHRANQLRSRLDPARPDVEAMDRIEELLGEALRIRNDVTRANLRLVVALAKGLVDRTSTFDDLVAEGHAPLVRAVELFDVDRGFRFSTYATWAVRNALHRFVRRNRRRDRHVQTRGDGPLASLADTSRDPRSEERRLDRVRRAATDWLDVLDARERLVVEQRFGIGVQSRPHRFREIAERIGLSTERVRQIFARSLERLREVANEDRVELE